MINQIIKTKDKVKSLLTKHPHLRDDDNKLIANFYFYESEKNLTMITAIDFLHDFANGKYTSFESIRRCRQKIQEEHPELRGNNYSQKQNEGKKFRKEVVNL